MRPRDFVAVSAALAAAGALAAFAIFGGAVPAAVAAAFSGAAPVATYKARRDRRRADARDAWPRMIEEIRLQTGALGRSVPQALFEVGRRGPEELRGAFAVAEREWLLSTDFTRTVGVLKARLSDATADAALETLLVAHDIGGTDLDRRLAALVEDRIQDLRGRKDARAKQAGVRFARRFVLIVPVGWRSPACPSAAAALRTRHRWTSSGCSGNCIGRCVLGVGRATVAVAGGGACVHRRGGVGAPASRSCCAALVARCHVAARRGSTDSEAVARPAPSALWPGQRTCARSRGRLRVLARGGGPLCVGRSERVSPRFGITEEAGARLERLHRPLDATGFRVRQSVGDSRVGGRFVTLTRHPPTRRRRRRCCSSSVARARLPRRRQQLASASASWQRRVSSSCQSRRTARDAAVGRFIHSAPPSTGWPNGGPGCAPRISIVCARVRQGLSEVDARAGVGRPGARAGPGPHRARARAERGRRRPWKPDVREERQHPR